MNIAKQYLCDNSAVTNRISEVLYNSYFFRNNDKVIIICHECFIYFTFLSSPTDFCFRELRKFFTKKFLLKGQEIQFPDKFKQLIFETQIK